MGSRKRTRDERFADYVPRSEGSPGQTSRPKRVYLDRVEWISMPDAATATAALRAGEVDCWEVPAADLVPQLRADGKLKVTVHDETGVVLILRFAFLACSRPSTGRSCELRCPWP